MMRYLATLLVCFAALLTPALVQSEPLRITIDEGIIEPMPFPHLLS